MIDKCHKGSDLFFQIKAFLRNCPFGRLFFHSAACSHPLPRCALEPPFAHAPLLFLPRCALGPPFAHAPLLFPLRCAPGPPFAHAPSFFPFSVHWGLLLHTHPPFSPSECTGASFCTRTASFPLRCAPGPPFAHAPLLFPLRCALRPSFCTRTAPFSPSVCTTALPCTREGRSEDIAKNLKDSFYNRIMHTSYANAFTTTIIIGFRSTFFCQSPGVHSGTRIQAGYTIARCSQSYCRSHRRSGYDRKSNNRHRCSR